MPTARPPKDRVSSKKPNAHSTPNEHDASTRTSDEGIGFLIRHTHRAFARTLADRLVAHGVTAAQWTVLRALWREDQCSQVDLAQRIRVEKASLTAVLLSLEQRKLIRRERSDVDRRVWSVHLTEAGRALEEVLLPFASQIDKLATKGFSKEEVSVLRHLLVRLMSNLD